MSFSQFSTLILPALATIVTAVIAKLPYPVPAVGPNLKARVRFYSLHKELCRAYSHSIKLTGLHRL